MDIPSLPIDGIDEIATRLERCAEHVDVQAVRVRAGTSETWRGEAADRHRERVAGHAADLTSLAEHLRLAAGRVRTLGSTARERLDRLAEIDRTVGATLPVGRWP